jgi:hypothetical protein
MIIAKVDYNKIDTNYLFKGKVSDYVDLLLIENKDGGRDKYGNDGFIVQGVSKEAKDAGEQGPILGNYRVYRKNETRGNRQPERRREDSRPRRDEYNQDDRDYRPSPRRERPPY